MRIAALRDTITVYNTAYGSGSGSGDVSDYGDPILREGQGVDVAASVEPFRLSTETFAGDSDKREVRYKVVADVTTVIDGLSRVVYRGESYEVWGEPGVFVHRNGPHHIEFMMRRVLGA